MGEHRAAVVIHVVPKTGKKGGLKGVFNTVTNAISVVGSLGLATMDDLTLPNDYEFKADFREAHLLRDGIEVVPAERLRLPAVAHEWLQEARGRELSFQGVYVYRPDDFAPHPDGSLPRFTLVIEDARKPGSPLRFDLDPQVPDAIRRDFSVYHPGTAPASAKAPISSPARVAAPSLCHSTYNPVALGMEWEYRSVMRSENRDGQQTTNETTSKQRISDLTPDTVTISWAQPGWMNDLQYRCENGHPLTPAQEVGGTRTTYRGTDIPAGSAPGLKWERVSETVGSDYRHVQVTRYEVVGMETITVAAGRFEALKVSYEMLPTETELFDKNGQKKKMPGDDLENRIHGFSWYAPQVGLVRNAYESTIKLKGKVDSTTESVQELVAFRP